MELDKLRKIIAEVLCVDTREITEETTFVDDLCADSLDLYQIVMGIEEEFSIEISQEDAEKITTVGEAVRLIRDSTGNGRQQV
ncbi:MAG TPA: acyl carrier protein [Candidatus Eisenbergiella intestinipullorum]|nr:acyl carrier protein [Candidatus Eisenbergiella intestinipullorum]